MSTPNYRHYFSSCIALLYIVFEKIQLKKVLFVNLLDVFRYRFVSIKNPYGGFNAVIIANSLPEFMADYFMCLNYSGDRSGVVKTDEEINKYYF